MYKSQSWSTIKSQVGLQVYQLIGYISLIIVILSHLEFCFNSSKI